jgi:hypothetical protein
MAKDRECVCVCVRLDPLVSVSVFFSLFYAEDGIQDLMHVGNVTLSCISLAPTWEATRNPSHRLPITPHNPILHLGSNFFPLITIMLGIKSKHKNLGNPLKPNPRHRSDQCERSSVLPVHLKVY